MKKNTTSIAIASIFAFTALFASAATYLNDQELGINEYREQAFNDSSRLNDSELGIGEHREQAFIDSNDSPRLDDRELGIGAYSDHA